MFTKDVSEKYQISLSMLKAFEEAGLFPLLSKDDKNCVYFEDDITRLSHIVTLQKIGMTLPLIKKYLDLKDQGVSTVEEMKRMLGMERLRNLNECHEKQNNISTIDYLIYKLEQH